MANRVSFKRHVDPDIFKAYLKQRGYSIRQLEMYCDTTERTIRNKKASHLLLHWTFVNFSDVILMIFSVLTIRKNGVKQWCLF